MKTPLGFLICCGAVWGSACSPGIGHRRVFITSDGYSGDLKTAAFAADGLAAGDALCGRAVAAAELGGIWTAWLSSPGNNAIDRIADVGPWYRLDGIRVFNNKTNLVTGSLGPIDRDENGRLVGGDTVWTGTSDGGTYSNSGACPDRSGQPWSAASGMGLAGVATSGTRWTEAMAVDCTKLGRLYCFEQ
jgi:hypothetical protein